MNEFEGRDVVVTGGAGGLGQSVVRELVQLGASCHLPLFETEPPVHFEFATHDLVKCYPSVNLTSEESASQFFGQVPELWASVHLAGGFSMAPMEETSADDVRKLFELNTMTSFLSSKGAASRMSDGGRIVNIGARPAVSPCGGMVAYSISKAAVVAMTRALAEELGPRGIYVNAVLPSIIDTPVNRDAMPDADHQSWPKPAELAQTICYLASPRNALTSGAVVPVYGRA